MRKHILASFSTRIVRFPLAALCFRERYKLLLAAESLKVLNHEVFTSYQSTAYPVSGTTATYQASFGTPARQQHDLQLTADSVRRAFRVLTRI